MKKFNYYNKIAHIYDETRWLTEAIAEEVADVILTLVNATPETSFLEPGVGTGLNIFPVVKRGYPVTGIDVSEEMLNQFRQKFSQIPSNLRLINADVSQIPFTNWSFDVVLTVHMIHAVSDWKIFLDEIARVLKPQGFYLYAQWENPPARKEFQTHFQDILARYKGEKTSTIFDSSIEQVNVEKYFCSKGYQSNYVIAKEWTVSNTVDELLEFYKSRAYGFCWQVSEKIFNLIMNDFEEFCVEYYGSLQSEVSSQAKFEIWVYHAK